MWLSYVSEWCYEGYWFGWITYFGGNEKFVLVHVHQSANVSADGPCVSHRLHNIAGAGLAFRSEHCCTFGDTTKGLTEVSTATYEWDFEVVFVDVIFLISHCEHFTFVDIVNFNWFKNLSLNEVSDACLVLSKGWPIEVSLICGDFLLDALWV